MNQDIIIYIQQHKIASDLASLVIFHYEIIFMLMYLNNNKLIDVLGIERSHATMISTHIQKTIGNKVMTYN